MSEVDKNSMTDTQELTPCPHCGVLPTDDAPYPINVDGILVVRHKSDCYRREPQFEILFPDNFDLWNARASPPAVDSQPAQYLSDDLRKVVGFAATCIILFANEGNYFRCLRCDGESLHGRSKATGNITHVKGCPVLLANEILFLDPQPVAAEQGKHCDDPNCELVWIDAHWGRRELLSRTPSVSRQPTLDSNALATLIFNYCVEVKFGCGQESLWQRDIQQIIDEWIAEPKPSVSPSEEEIACYVLNSERQGGE